MSELSAAAAAALGVPEAIVQRSAAARAEEAGMSVDDVLAAWSGGGSVAASAPAEAASAPADAPGPAAPPSAGEAPTGPPAEQGDIPPPSSADAPAGAPAEQGDIAQPSPGQAPTGPPAVVSRSPVPAEVTAAEAANLPEVITVPTAGIRERMNLAVPRWLASVMLIIPAFALFALGGSATDTCGEATELQTDVVTGQIVNCDGSEFTGSGVGGGGADFIAQGEAIYLAAPGNCQGCHGATGGGGVGPGFGGVVTTFGSCTDHIEWVALGTPGFQADGRSTYGDTNKPVGGVGLMPEFGTKLSEEQLASVVAFERVRFGGADPAQTLTDCGLAPAEGEEGGEGDAPGEETPGEEAPAEEGETTSTTESGAEAGAPATG